MTDTVSARPLRVLLIGATGVFGRRLAEQLFAEPGIEPVLACRSVDRVRALLAQDGRAGHAVRIDRDTLTGNDLAALGCDVVIDAAGPFQDSHSRVIEAAIDCGCHYIDLADCRRFVTGIQRFHACAARRGIAVISGASSTPALSHAVISRLTADWRRIDALTVAISPGNRAPRGMAVMRAVLSYVGRPVRLFDRGRWTTEPGWGLTRAVDFPNVGRRLVSLCETPDLDLLVERYRPTERALFLAGLELRSLHLGLWLCSLPVRWRLIRSLRPAAGLLHAIANRVRMLGSNHGGMVVAATGADAAGEAIHACWWLAASADRGPYVPTLAALALVRRMRDGTLDLTGARPCVDILSLEDFVERFHHFGIVTGSERIAGTMLATPEHAPTHPP